MVECANVPVTGLGVISAAGTGVSATLQTLQKPRKDPTRVTLFETGLHVPVFEVQEEGLSVGSGLMRTHDLAMKAVEEALRDFPVEALREKRVGVALGTTVAAQLNDLSFYAQWRSEKKAPMDAVDRFLNGNLAEFVAQKLGVQGPTVTIVNACSSGADAIAVASSWIRNGLCDAAIAGGSDELNRVPLCGFHALGVMSDAPCRPFDKNRSGLNLGEGAGVLLLESEQSVQARGGEMLAWLAGAGTAVDAYHLTAPHPEAKGLRAAIQNAFKMAGIKGDDLAFINAHGTSTRENDVVEGRCLSQLFPGTPTLSTKGYTGHTLGAAGGIEAVLTVAGLRSKWVPANAGFETEDEEIGMIPVCEKREIHGCYALSTSLAFGGSNAALIVKSCV